MTEHTDSCILLGYQALAALPLIIDGAAIGVITLFSGQSGVFDAAELGVLLELDREYRLCASISREGRSGSVSSPTSTA